MYQIQAESSFDAAHFLKGYEGKCKNLHGHRWRVVAAAEGASLQASGPQAGMLMDFSDLKEALKALTDALDHSFLVEQGSLQEATVEALRSEGFRLVPFPFPTTAENLSRYFFKALLEKGLPVSSVSVYETPTNCATFTREDENIVWL